VTPCANCTETQDYCLSCLAGFYYWTEVEGKCPDYCPDGFTANGTSHECDRDGNLLILNYTFGEIHPVYTSNMPPALKDTKIRIGDDETYYPQNIAADDAYPVIGRGLYLTGTSELHLPPPKVSTAEMVGQTHTILSPTFTFEAWAKLYSTGAPQVFFGKYNPTTYAKEIEFSWYENAADPKELRIYENGTTTTSNDSFGHTPDNKWHLYSVTVSWDIPNRGQLY
jgi:hypothetical protein